MPRKASKTDHVLDLISGKEEENQKKEAKRKKVKLIEDSVDASLENGLSELIQGNLEKQVEKKKAPVSKPKKAPQKKKDSFNYVNVMEAVVQSSIHKVVEKFDMCNCERCIADVMALSLTNLPAKYVVTNQQVSPLLNYYSNKYAEIVNIELMKSCTLIKQYPHHNRE